MRRPRRRSSSEDGAVPHLSRLVLPHRRRSSPPPPVRVHRRTLPGPQPTHRGNPTRGLRARPVGVERRPPHPRQTTLNHTTIRHPVGTLNPPAAATRFSLGTTPPAPPHGHLFTRRHAAPLTLSPQMRGAAPVCSTHCPNPRWPRHSHPPRKRDPTTPAADTTPTTTHKPPAQTPHPQPPE